MNLKRLAVFIIAVLLVFSLNTYGKTKKITKIGVYPLICVKGGIQSADQLKELSEQVQSILEKLQSTAGYDIGQAFRCNSCYSQGMVAIRVKCTECGRENWWGWWPEKSS